MADIAITAANVVAGSDANTAHGIAGETLTAGLAKSTTALALNVQFPNVAN